MKHKWNLLVALLVIMALALVACGGGETTDEDQEPAATEATTDDGEGEEAEPTEEMAEEPTEEMVEEATEEPMEEATEEPMEEATEEPMEEPTEEAPADATTITLWHGWDGAYYEAIEDVFTAYEEMHPEVNIELVRQDNLSDAMAWPSRPVKAPTFWPGCKTRSAATL
jgi:ABC-type glycerol-3-phosphate transport system substrate-binding protein